jgi:GAF domain-containing protein
VVEQGQLLNALRQFATRSVENYDLAVVLDEVTAQARDVLALDGAGITLKVVRLTKETQYITATDDSTLQVEHKQDELREGPCVDAMKRGEPVVAEDILSTDRWPRYTPTVIEAGFRGVAGIPMLAAGRVVGALNAYRRQPGGWTAEELAAGTLFANVATSYIANASAYADQAEVASQLQRALDSRVLIEQAKGMLAERHGVSLDAGFDAMRQYARNERRPLRDVAADVVNGTASIEV